MNDAFCYREIVPPVALGSSVISLWSFRPDPSLTVPMVQRLLPDGCIDLVFHLGAAPAVSGHVRMVTAQARSWFVGPLQGGTLVRFERGAHVVAACLRPGGANRVLGTPASSLAARFTSVNDVWGSAIRTFEDEVATGPEGSALERLGSALLRHCKRPGEHEIDRLAIEATRRIQAARGAVAIADLAADLGVSTRQLERRFTPHVGLTPKAFCRVARFDALVRALRTGRSRAPWCERALDYGYADQAHLAHEFRELARITPTTFERELSTGPDHVAFLQDNEASLT